MIFICYICKKLYMKIKIRNRPLKISKKNIALSWFFLSKNLIAITLTNGNNFVKGLLYLLIYIILIVAFLIDISILLIYGILLVFNHIYKEYIMPTTKYFLKKIITVISNLLGKTGSLIVKYSFIVIIFFTIVIIFLRWDEVKDIIFLLWEKLKIYSSQSQSVPE